MDRKKEKTRSTNKIGSTPNIGTGGAVAKNGAGRRQVSR